MSVRRALLLPKMTALVACVLALALTGCLRSTPTPEPVTISFAHADYDTAYMQRLLETFGESYPYITVELRPKRWDTLGGLGAGDADAFVTSQFAVSWLSEQGSILDLTPFIEQDQAFDQEDFYPGTLGLYMREGKTWAIPANVDLMVMYYNQDLLDQYDAPYPKIGWDWDGFLATAMLVRDPAADTFGYIPGAEAFDALTFIYQHGGRIFDNLANPTRTTFDDPLTIEALDWYADLFYRHDVAPTQEQIRQSFTRGNPRVGVWIGRVGMWTGMLSEQGGRTWPTEWDMRWGVAPLPRDQQSMTLTLVEGYFISAQTKHPDACWRWISFLSKQMPQRQAPARKSLAESTEYEEQVGREIATVVQTSMDNVLLLSPELASYEESLDTFTQAFNTIMDGTSTAEEAMTWAQQQSTFK
jgi:ABC-type glycerol-3-phosphate transport system substrate-binding protein